MLRDYASLAGWAFLPHYATQFVLQVYWGFFYKFGDKPRPGTRSYVKQYRRTHAALVIGYLLLTIYDAYDQIRKNGDFYQLLGVGHDATDRGIKSRFRRLAAQYHPDKQSTAGPAASEDAFVALRIAQETLLNPVKRFAYDRFGPTMLDWEHCASIKDYLHAGFQFYSPSYVGAGLMTLALSSMGYLEWGKYWRYLSGASIILIEIHTLTRPNPPGIATILLNPLLSILPNHQPQLLPFQILLLARKIGLATSIAISQLGTHSDSSNSSISSGAGGYNDIDPIRLQHLETLTLAIDNTTTRLLHMDVAPFESSSSLVGNGDGNGDGRSSSPQLLTAGMVDWLCRNAERADPAVRGAIVRVLQSSARGSGSGDGDLEDDDDDDEKDKRVS